MSNSMKRKYKPKPFWCANLGKHLVEIPIKDARSVCQDVQLYWRGPLSGHWYEVAPPRTIRHHVQAGHSINSLFKLTDTYAVEVVPPKPEYDG